MPARRLPKRTVAAVDDSSIIGIRAGREPHRVIGVWAVVVEGRVFVRSWSLKPRSWFSTFQEDPVGELHIDGRVVRIRAVLTRSERLKDAVSAAYRAKYHTPASLKYVRDMSRPKSRNTTTELVPR